MSTLQVANVQFESTGANRIEYTGNNVIRVKGSGLQLPTVTNATKPSPEPGMMLYNSDTGNMEMMGAGGAGLSFASNSSVGAVFAVANAAFGKANTALQNATGTLVGTLYTTTGLGVGSTTSLVGGSLLTVTGNTSGAWISSCAKSLSSNTAKLGVYIDHNSNDGSIYNGIGFRGQSSYDMYFGRPAGSADDLIISRSNYDTTELFRFTAGGKLGIGTSSPGGKLTTYTSSGGVYTEVTSGGTSGTSTDYAYNMAAVMGTYAGGVYNIIYGSGIGYTYYSANNGQYWVGTSQNSPLVFYTNNGEKMRITAGGSIGIGSSNPNSPLSLMSSGTGVSINFNANGLTNASNRGGLINYWYDGSSTYYKDFWNWESNGVVRIGTAGAERFKIDSSGRITRPYQPVFLGVGRSGGTPLNTGSESTYTIWNPNSVQLNRGSHFNTSTGRYTCPVAGVYQVSIFLLCRYSSSGGAHNIQIFKNGSGTSILGRDIVYGSNELNTGLLGYVDCAANDILDVRVSNSSGCDFYPDFNSYAISLFG